MRTARIGLLFLFGGGRGGLARFLLLVGGTALGVLCLLGALSFPYVIGQRQERAERRIPVTDREGMSEAWYHTTTRQVGTDPLPVTFVAGEHAPLPPGVAALPGFDEAIVSPALASALEADPQLRAVFPYAVSGSISEAGLTGPDEWYAYVGTTREDLPRGGRRLGGFGSDINPEVDLAQGDVTFINLSLLGVVGIPLLIYFAVTARLSAATRLRRLAALRLLGATVSETQKVNAVESAGAALLGGALALAVYAAAHPLLASFGIAGIAWFPTDSRPGASLAFVALVVVPVLATTVSRTSSRRAITRALAARREEAAGPARTWRLAPLLIGIAILAALVLNGFRSAPGVGLGDEGALLLMAGVGFTAVGLVFGFEIIPVSAGRLLARRIDRLPVLLAMRRLEFEPAGPTRVVAGLAVAIFAMGFANGIQRDAEASSLPLADRHLYELSGAELDGVGIADLRGVSGVTAAAAKAQSDPVDVAGPNPTYVDLTWATCGDLATLVGPVPGCADTGFRVVPDRARPLSPVPPAGTRLVVPGSGASRLLLKVPRKTLRLPQSQILALGNLQVVLPPSGLAGRPVPRGGYVVLSSGSEPETLRSVTLGLARVAPQATITFANANFDARRRAVVAQGILSASVLIGLVIGVAAFLVASLDRIVERRRHLVSLAIVGVPARTQRVAQSLQVLVPMLAGAIVAVAAGKLAEQATVMVGGVERGWDWGPTVTAVIAGLVASVIAVGSAAVAIGRKIDVSLIRRD